MMRDRHPLGHLHDHDHGDRHDHRDTARGAMFVALALIVVFMAVEVVAGLLVGSVALLADAAHMLTDAAAIVTGLVAGRLAARPARGGWTFGFARAEVLSAQANGITLLAAAVLIGYESVRRLIDPHTVEGGWVLAVALVGVVVSLAATWVLAKGSRDSLNLEGVYQHVLTDVYAFAGTAIAGGVILATGYDRADPIASLVVVALMVLTAARLLMRTGRVLLEAAPEGMRPAGIQADLVAHPAVESVHDLHVWLITSGFPAISAHVLVEPGADCHRVRRDLEGLLAERHGIEHTTLQVDHVEEHLLSITERPAPDG